MRRNLYGERRTLNPLVERRELPIALMRDVASKLRRAASELGQLIEDVRSGEDEADHR